MELNNWVYIYLALAIALTNVPYVGVYFALANTLIHEVSHIIAAILTGGKAHQISLHHDASGLATTSTTSWLGKVLVSYAGYTGASIAAVGLFYAVFKGYYELILYFFIGISSMFLILWTKNLFSIKNLLGTVSIAVVCLFYAIFRGEYQVVLYFLVGISIVFLALWMKNLFENKNSFRAKSLFGLFWSVTFLSGVIFILYKDIDIIIKHVSIFLSCIVMVQSVLTSFIILKLSIKQKNNAGDATSLAEATHISAFIWGLLFFIQSLYAGHYAVTHYII